MTRTKIAWALTASGVTVGAVVIVLACAWQRLEAQHKPTPNPCHVVVFKETQDSLYAELQAPRGTKRCVVEIK